MSSRAARKSACSPTPWSNTPALAPTPRKLKRITAQPMRVRPFAPWNTALVCIVPPCCGCGWAKTTAARGDALWPSIIISSGPAGPGMESRTSAYLVDRGGRGHPLATLDELRDGRRPLLRPRCYAQMTRAFERHVTSAANERVVLERRADGHHAIEIGLACDDERGRGDAGALRGNVRGGPSADARGHERR